MNHEEATFGIKSEKGSRAKECLNPSKNYDEVEKEYENKRDLYKLSHLSSNVRCNEFHFNNTSILHLGRGAETARLHSSTFR